MDTSDRQSLPCPTILFRSVFPAQMEEGRVHLTTFLLKPKDHGELSVWLSSTDAWTRLRNVRRVVSLHTGRVGGLQLEVVADPSDPSHALILGLPNPLESEEAFIAANSIARLLLQVSRAVR